MIGAVKEMHLATMENIAKQRNASPESMAYFQEKFESIGEKFAKLPTQEQQIALHLYDEAAVHLKAKYGAVVSPEVKAGPSVSRKPSPGMRVTP